MIQTKKRVRKTKSEFRLCHQSQADRLHNLKIKKSKLSVPTFEIEKELWGEGYEFVCGIDEAGRGALAGPLVSAAVILPKKLNDLPYRDSKQLSAKDREEIFKIIQKESLAWATGLSSREEIDNFGIQSATYLSFNKAISGLKINPHFLLIDYYRLPGITIKQRSLKFGDRVSFSIAAASIVAKVTRDKIMNELGETKIGLKYCFKENLGYGTQAHKRIIGKIGLSDYHRRSFCKFDSMAQKRFNF